MATGPSKRSARPRGLNARWRRHWAMIWMRRSAETAAGWGLIAKLGIRTCPPVRLRLSIMLMRRQSWRGALPRSPLWTLTRGRTLAVGQRLVTRDGRLRRWDGFVSEGEGAAAAERLERLNRLAEIEALLPAARAGVDLARQTVGGSAGCHRCHARSR